MTAITYWRHQLTSHWKSKYLFLPFQIVSIVDVVKSLIILCFYVSYNVVWLADHIIAASSPPTTSMKHNGSFFDAVAVIIVPIISNTENSKILDGR